MLVFDVHAHLGAGASTATSTKEGLINSLKEAGVSKVVVFPIRSYDMSVQYSDLNNQVMDLHNEFPDLIIPFIRLGPGFTKADLLKHPLTRGVKLHFNNDKWNMESLRNALTIIKDTELVVLFHSNADLMTELLLLIKEFNSVKFIAAHAGRKKSYLKAFKDCKNLYFDTSIKTSPFTLKILMSIDEDRILFGSDYPFSTPLIERFKIEHTPYLTLEQKEKILGLNADKLFRTINANNKE